MAPPEKQVFLTAEWRNLVMLNYEVNGGLLQQYVPRGTELDSFRGKTYLSLVGFEFRNTRLFGRFSVPFHAEFEEVNLRFYVRRKAGSEDRRGVVFIAEIVPKWAVAGLARLVYGENYVCLPMKHRIRTNEPSSIAEYQWRRNGVWCRLHAHAPTAAAAVTKGSLEQFITEHYWGYANRRNGGALEYRVEHVPWKVKTATAAGFEGDVKTLYGPELGRILEGQATCAFIAEGSPVIVYKGLRI